MLYALLQEMRPKQWTKNLLVFAGIVFSQNLDNGLMLKNAILAFIAFCFLSGGGYILNDIKDLQSDREHPTKRNRPLASGKIPTSVALIFGIVFCLGALIGSFFITIGFGIVALSYFVLMNSYSLFLKHIVIVDIMIVSIGFVLRAVAGVEAIRVPGAAVPMTPWFIACTLFLALFLIICKRRHELLLLNERASNHRKVLQEYSPAFIDQMTAVVTSLTIISYALWTTIGYTRQNMVYTLPFVIYGIFRYLYLTYHKEEGGAPEILLITDRPLLISILLWMISVVILLYFAKPLPT